LSKETGFNLDLFADLRLPKNIFLSEDGAM
jgi:hypothetical protein